MSTQINTTGTGLIYSFSPKQIEVASKQLRRLFDIGKRYINRKVKKMIKPEIKLTNKIGGKGTDIIDLSKNVVRVEPGTKQKTALFNEFVETKNRSLYKAKDIKQNKVKTLGDSNIPTSNFTLFGGIENEKLRIDKPQNFNDTTTIFPVRNIKKNTKPIKQIYIQPPKSIYGITVDQDTVPISEYNTSIFDTKKFVLGNSLGNSLFIGDFVKMSPQQFDYVNSHLQKNPSYPIRTDLGSFELYRTDNPTFKDYMNQFLDVYGDYDPNSMYVVGTK